MAIADSIVNFIAGLLVELGLFGSLALLFVLICVFDTFSDIVDMLWPKRKAK